MIWLALPALGAAAYWLLVILAAVKWRGAPESEKCLPISVLKPIRGRDPHFYEAIRSHALQRYPEFEILFGASDRNDPAVEDIRRLMAEFPNRRIRLIETSTKLPNAKVGTLADLATEARYQLLLINDSDIRVPPDYLRQCVGALDQAGTGLVTCLYRAQADTRPGRWEALGVSTEFAPSVLVARLLHAAEFACGATLLLRAQDLARIGGFAVIGDYLADDYQLGLRISRLGLRVAFAPTVLATHLDAESWSQAWRHQLRWSRTIRVSRPGGYFGYVVTHATLWSLVASLAGVWPAGAIALAARLLGGILTARLLEDRISARHFYLMPLRDLWGFAIWLCGLFGNTVYWRGEKLRLTKDGRIRPQS